MRTECCDVVLITLAEQNDGKKIYLMHSLDVGVLLPVWSLLHMVRLPYPSNNQTDLAQQPSQITL